MNLAAALASLNKIFAFSKDKNSFLALCLILQIHLSNINIVGKFKFKVSKYPVEFKVSTYILCFSK